MHTPAVSDRRLTRLVLIAALLHGLSFFFAVAPWMGEDEPWQFEYASHVADGHRPWGGRKYDPKAEVDERTLMAASQLQIRERIAGISDAELQSRQRVILDSMEEEQFFRRVDWAGATSDRVDFDQITPFFTASKQPPGYFAVLGVWMWPFSRATLETQLAWARVSSLLLYLAAVWIVLQLANVAFTDRSLALAAVLAFAWFPLNARQAAVINNDVLARTLGAWVLMLCARRLAGDESKRTVALAAGVAAVALLLIKPTTMSLFGALYVTLFLSAKTAGRRLVVLLVGVLVIVGALVFWREVQTTVLPRNLQAFFDRLQRGTAFDAFVVFGKSFIGGFNWMTREMSSTTYALVAGVLGLACFSAFTALFHTRRGVSRPILALCFVVVFFQLVLIVLRGMGHGRYMMPVVPALAVIVAVGLIGPFSDFRRPMALRFFAALLCLYDVVYFWGGLVPNEYLVWGS